jgi:molybdopterin-biosynthesis enzyme MoeA-like protein
MTDSTPQSVPTIGLIVIGDEILSGKRQDKHLPKVVELLSQRGLTLGWAEYVGDDPERITATLKRAFASGDLVFSTGGIGATPDDHTRSCAAHALGVPLVLHPQAKALIEERMRDVAAEQGVAFAPEHADYLRRLNMGIFPAGAQIIPNPYNKIPGFSCRSSRASDEVQDAPWDAAVHFVPGFPVMAWPMVEWVLDHRYGHMHHLTAHAERSVIVFGAMEATLTPVMERIEASFPGVKIFSLPGVDHPQYGRHIDLGVKGTPDAVAAAYAELRTQLAPLNLSYGPELVR